MASEFKCFRCGWGSVIPWVIPNEIYIFSLRSSWTIKICTALRGLYDVNATLGTLKWRSTLKWKRLQFYWNNYGFLCFATIKTAGTYADFVFSSLFFSFCFSCCPLALLDSLIKKQRKSPTSAWIDADFHVKCEQPTVNQTIGSFNFAFVKSSMLFYTLTESVSSHFLLLLSLSPSPHLLSLQIFLKWNAWKLSENDRFDLLWNGVF